MKNSEKVTCDGEDIPIQSMSIFKFHQDLDDWTQFTYHMSFGNCFKMLNSLRDKDPDGEYMIMIGLDI